MSDESPNPLSDVIKGLGLLLRAAKTTVEQLPKKNFEEAILTSAREVGRAIENVATTVEREVFRRQGGGAASRPPEKDAPGPEGSDEKDPDPPPSP